MDVVEAEEELSMGGLESTPVKGGAEGTRSAESQGKSEFDIKPLDMLNKLMSFIDSSILYYTS